MNPIKPLPASVARKHAIRELFDRLAPDRGRWLERNAYFYAEDGRYLRFLVPEGQRVLELGCGNGQLLASLNPSLGVGIDISEAMVERARHDHPGHTFHVGDIEDPAALEGLDGPFDVVVLSDTLGLLEDCQAALENIHAVCAPHTRVIVSYYSQYWEPMLRVAEWIGARMPQPVHNWLSSDDVAALLDLSGFEPLKREWRTLVPRRLLGLGTAINRYLAPLPLVRRLCLRHFVVARPTPRESLPDLPVTVLVPCKNERGNVEPAVLRTPAFGRAQELLFVEGGSSDGTFEEIERVIAAHPERDIKVLRQTGKGKGNAVREGFEAASGDVLMILDADLTVPPETLPRFYRALVEGQGEFINGSRLVYPLEDEAMRFLNEVANHTFSKLFTWLLNQRLTDTLCGTKVLRKRDYERIAANRAYFGDFDPFGDFDLILGASKLNLKVVEVPIRYQARAYGETQISRFRHGWLLVRMVAFAFRKLKAF